MSQISCLVPEELKNAKFFEIKKVGSRFKFKTPQGVVSYATKWEAKKWSELTKEYYGEACHA
jgi:hypothetical protein